MPGFLGVSGQFHNPTGGTFDTSPAIHCWEVGFLTVPARPVGTLENLVIEPRFKRPSGTRSLARSPQPSDESLGYFQVPLRGSDERIDRSPGSNSLHYL